MKKLIAWLLLCLLLCTSASAEVAAELVVNEDLLAFENELTGEVVRIGMTADEIGAIAGQAYEVRRTFKGNAFAYDGGLLVFYDPDWKAIIITAIPVMLDGENAFDFEMEENITVERAYSPHGNPGYGMDVIQNSTGTVMEQAELDRSEVEAITGPAKREYVVDTFCFVEWDDTIGAFEAYEPGAVIIADYEGISVMYVIQPGDGEVRASYFFSGLWYKPASGFTMGDSVEAIEAQLGACAQRPDEEFIKKYGYDYLRTYLYSGEDGYRFIDGDEMSQLKEKNGGWMNTYELFYRLGKEGKVTRVQVKDWMIGWVLMSNIDAQ